MRQLSNDTLIYQIGGDSPATEVLLQGETVWLTQKQMSDLFETSTDNIGLHLKNIYRSDELTEESTAEDFSVVRLEGKRRVRRTLKHYNLDAIISVGYRVNSKQGTRFRIWANRVLKEYLTRGYALNEKRLKEQQAKMSDLRNTVALLEKTLAHQAVGEDEAKGLLKVIADYAYALTTLDRYDHGNLDIGGTTTPSGFVLDYDEAMQLVTSMKGEFDGLFGIENVRH